MSRSRSTSPAASSTITKEDALNSPRSRSPSPRHSRSRSASPSSESEEVCHFLDKRAAQRALTRTEQHITTLKQHLADEEAALYREKLRLVQLELEATRRCCAALEQPPERHRSPARAEPPAERRHSPLRHRGKEGERSPRRHRSPTRTERLREERRREEREREERRREERRRDEEREREERRREERRRDEEVRYRHQERAPSPRRRGKRGGVKNKRRRDDGWPQPDVYQPVLTQQPEARAQEESGEDRPLFIDLRKRTDRATQSTDEHTVVSAC